MKCCHIVRAFPVKFCENKSTHRIYYGPNRTRIFIESCEEHVSVLKEPNDLVERIYDKESGPSKQ